MISSFSGRLFSAAMFALTPAASFSIDRTSSFLTGVVRA
jgi:hypothetical protein